MKALKNINLNSVVFIDIETVNLVPVLIKGTPLWDSWEYKQKDKLTSEDIAIRDKEIMDSYVKSGALYPEFAKICAISIGKVKDNTLHVKNYYGDNEAKLLNTFTTDMDNILAANKATVLAGHCVKGFDLPFIVRRSIINGIQPASLCDPGTSKPWESTTLDIFEIWKGTSFNSASLINMAVALGLNHSKDDIAGYEVAATYWGKEESYLERIATYCSKDVLVTTNIFLKMALLPTVEFAQNKKVEVVEHTPLLTKLFNGGKYTLPMAKKLTDEYAKLDDKGKQAMELILRSIPDKNTSFTIENVEAIINYVPKTK